MTFIGLVVAIFRGLHLPWYVWVCMVIDGTIGWASLLSDVFKH